MEWVVGLAIEARRVDDDLELVRMSRGRWSEGDWKELIEWQ